MYVISVDVGSGSVRCAIIEFNNGTMNGIPIASAIKSITIYNPKADHYEQRSDEIWDAVCHCVNECITKGHVTHQMVSGIGFSSTCSLVIVEENCDANDVILWMDHRAVSEARMINETNHPVLQQFGGKCSPEFSISKLVWLKRNQTQRFNNALAFMELPDWLTWKCSTFACHDTKLSTQFPRSLCSVVCKWGFDSESHKWRDDLFGIIGLEEFIDDKTKIGEKIVSPGIRIGYLSQYAAERFGLRQTPNNESPISISCPLIDAHSGVLAMITFFSSSLSEEKLLLSPSDEHQMYDSIFCMIAGTSTCHMVSTRDRQFTNGVWGPYYNSIFPGYYTREAGQSATGKLIEHIIRSHPQWENEYSKYPLENLIKDMNEKILTLHATNTGINVKHKLHINPSFHGNRSPLANPTLKGGVYGLSLEKNSLIEWYEATIEALAYESKFILEELKIPNLKNVLISGGLAKNAVYMQTHADVLNVEVCTFAAGDADLMLVGSAILAYQSANDGDLSAEMLRRIKYPHLRIETYKPKPEVQRYHYVKYKCYRQLLESAMKIEDIINEFEK